MAVDLPQINNTPLQVQAPQSRVSPAQVASPYLELANMQEHEARETGGLAKLFAHEEGLKAVTRDENGNVKIDHPVIVGDAALSYKQAMQTAAVADGEEVIKSDMLRMRHEHRDDPAGFAKAAETYSREKVKQYDQAAGPAVGIALGRVAANVSRETHEGLLNEKERHDLQRATASIEIQIDKTKNELFGLAAGGADMTSPEVTQRLQKIGALWGSLVNNPRIGIPKERMDYEVEALKSQLYVSTVDAKLAKIQSEKGIDAALAEVEKVRTDPSLNLTPGQRLSYANQLTGAIQSRVNAQNHVDKQTDTEIRAIEKISETGFPVPPERLAAARNAAIQSGNPALVAELTAVESIQPVVAAWRKMSPAQLERALSETERTMMASGATPALLALRKTGDALLKNMQTAIKHDPLGWADRTGAVAVPPVDWSNADTLPAQLRGRAAAAESVAQLYGSTPAYLRPDEKAGLTRAAAQGGDGMTAVAGTIVAGFGDRAPHVLREIGHDAPVLAHVGSLMNTGGSSAVINDAAEAVKLRADPELRKLLPHWLTREPDKMQAAQNERTTSVYGGAFAVVPDTGRAAELTAQAAFFTRAKRNNYDPSFVEGDTKASQRAYDRSLQEAAGATFAPSGVQYGGVADFRSGWFSGSKRVLVPGNVRADNFRDVVGALRDEDLGGTWQVSGHTFGARDLQNATPVAAPGGYRFAAGDPLSDDPKWIPNANGRPLVVDIDRLEPVLRKRVPQAYADRAPQAQAVP